MVLKVGNHFYSRILESNLCLEEPGSETCSWGNLLYNIYAHMAVLVYRQIESGPCDTPYDRELHNVYEVFRVAGFYSSYLLPQSKTWAQGLGKYSARRYGLEFSPTLGEPDIPLITETGFWNKASAELLPNVEIVFKCALGFEETTTFNSSRSLFSRLVHLSGVDLELVPGFSDFRPKPVAPFLKALISKIAARSYKGPLMEYLHMDIELLRYLRNTYSCIYSKVEGAFNASMLENVVTELAMLPCIESYSFEEHACERIALVAHERGATLRSKRNTAAHVVRIFGKWKSKSDKDASRVPLVRIASSHNRIFEDNADRAHSDWFYTDFDFCTVQFLLGFFINDLGIT